MTTLVQDSFLHVQMAMPKEKSVRVSSCDQADSKRDVCGARIVM